MIASLDELPARLAADPGVQAVREALAGGPPAWLVGGVVRDALLGRPLADIDLAVDGDPAAAARAVAGAVRGTAFGLSEAFGGWRAVARRGGWVCDVSPLQGATIDEDLARRDFSVNALAVPLADGPPLDPTGGAGDLARGVLRVLGGDDVERSAYGADSLRPLRAVRLATELGLTPDARTERLTAAAAQRVVEASPERVWAELRRIVAADRALDGLRLADRLGVLGAVLPEVEAMRGLEQSHFHHLDVHAHTFEVVARQLELERAPAEWFGEEIGTRLAALLAEPLGDELTRGHALRLGALLHDVGKPPTRAVRPDGRVTFIGHDSVGAEIAERICHRLRTSERIRSFVAGLTRHHLHLGFLVHERPLSRRAVFAYLSLTEPVEVEVTLLTCADRLATRGKNADRAIALHLDLARELLGHALDWRAAGGAPRPPVRGDELARRLGIRPGPQLGPLLAALQEASYAGEIGSADEAVEFARRLRDNPGR